jgi:uncharacterized protein DUF559
MNDALLRSLARRQAGTFAVWQLRDEGMSRAAVDHHVRRHRRIHDGVYVTGDAPVTRWQRWWAATLTAPERYLSQFSSGAAYGFLTWDPGFEIVTTHGCGGRVRYGDVVVCRSRSLDGHTGALRGLPITSPARTLADLCPRLSAKQLARCVREALRLRVVTCAELQAALATSGPRNRPRALSDLAASYARLPIHRTRSDPEAHALEVLDAAGIPAPLVNVDVAGHEADLVWHDRRLIIELDGPQFHLFATQDAIKTAAWEAAGWTVRRLPTGDVYDRPRRLLAMATEPT